MYEIHGWIRLAESPDDIDEGELDAKVDRLATLVAAVPLPGGLFELLAVNGSRTLVVHIDTNRRRPGLEHALDEILAFVTGELPGSYGVLYEYDEQDRVHHGRGVFSVRVVKRGRCEPALDPFLSPLVPVAENPS